MNKENTDQLTKQIFLDFVQSKLFRDACIKANKNNMKELQNKIKIKLNKYLEDVNRSQYHKHKSLKKYLLQKQDDKHKKQSTLLQQELVNIQNQINSYLQSVGEQNKSNKKLKWKKDTMTKSSVVGNKEQNVFDENYDKDIEDSSIDFSKRTPQFDQSVQIENIQKNVEKLTKKIQSLEEEMSQLKSALNEQKEISKMSKSFNMTPYTTKTNKDKEVSSESETSFDKKELILAPEDESDNSQIKGEVISFGSAITDKSVKKNNKDQIKKQQNFIKPLLIIQLKQTHIKYVKI